MPEFNPSINIIILNYYRKNDTLACLESLEKNTSDINFKVILINNSPEDYFHSSDLTKYKYTIDYIVPNKNLGFCGGNNLGLKKSLEDIDCKYIMLLNNDTEIELGLLEKLKLEFDHNPDTLLSPVIVFHDTRKIQCTGGYWSLFFGVAVNINKGKKPKLVKAAVYPSYLNGCCIFTGKEVFEKTGFFDEEFFAYGEDIDLSVRAKKSGYKLKVLSGAFVYHKHSKSIQSYRKQYLICRSNVLLIKKHYRLLYFYLLFAIHFISQLATGFFVFKNRRVLKMINSIINGYCDGLKGVVDDIK